MAGMRLADESYVVSFTGNSCGLWWKTCQRASREPQRLDLLGDRGRKKDSNSSDASKCACRNAPLRASVFEILVCWPATRFGRAKWKGSDAMENNSRCF